MIFSQPYKCQLNTIYSTTNDRLNATYSKFILESQLNQRTGIAATAPGTVASTSRTTTAGRGRSSAAAVSVPNTVSTPINRAQANPIKRGECRSHFSFYTRQNENWIRY